MGRRRENPHYTQRRRGGVALGAPAADNRPSATEEDRLATATERLPGNGDWLPDIGGRSSIDYKM
jgi:hypothetical protein